METKHCSGCKESKPLDEFGLDSRVPSGRQSRCRECDTKAKSGKYRNMTSEEKRKFLDDLGPRNKKHREKKIAAGICITCTRKAVPGYRLCEVHRKYHRDGQKFRTLRAGEKGLCLACGCRPQVPGYKHCAICKQRTKDYWLELRIEVQTAYGGKCQCCGEVGPLFLTVDHILNNGAAHRRELLLGRAGGQGFYLWLRKNNFPQEDFQLLCMTCNFGKRMNGGICPHKTDPVGHPLPLRSAA